MKLNEEINLKTKNALLPRPRPVPGKLKPNKTQERQPEESQSEKEVPKTRTELLKSSSDLQELQKNATISSSPSSSKSIARNVQRPAAPPVVPHALERRNLSSEGLIKFLKSKVTILQDEIDLQQKENLKKTEELQTLVQRTTKWEKNRDELVAKNNSLQADLKRSEERIIELELKVKERDNDTVRLGKEGEGARRDLKTLQQTIAGLERRLLAAQNETEALKVNLASAYERERETRDQARAEKDAAEKQIKQLRKQRLTLITAYKHQLLLLDNLKRQNLCLEESKLLEFSEKEFTKILNWEK